jgi:hypothetical protein
MRGLLIISVLIAHIVVPLMAAREVSLRRGVQKTALILLLVNTLYALGIRYAYLFD